MDKSVTNFSVKFRDLIAKAAKENFFDNKIEHVDPIALTERYKSILDNVNGFVLVANYVTGTYEYVSDGFYSHLGFDVTKLPQNQITDFVVSVIKEEHKAFMINELLPTVLKYFREHATPATGLDYRYTCCFKLRNVRDEYHWYLVDTVLIEVDNDGFPLRTVVTATNVNQIKRDECLYYNITKKNADGIYEVVFEGVGSNQTDDLNLTRRELQLISLIARGYTNKQIADSLFISVNTVQTHRKSIMKKTGCSGIAELTNLAFSRGLL